MTLRHLKIFIAVCEHKSTTKASEVLYIAQPTVSLAISELEKYYNVTLFDRINQRLILTDIGKELLVKAKDILSGFEDFESLATFRGKSPKVKIGASLTLGQIIIPKLLRIIDEQKLDVQPQIFIRQASVIEHELEQGNLDFAIIGGDVISPYLSSTPISYDRFTAVANVDYDTPSTLSFEQLLSYPLLLREQGSSSRDFLEKIAFSKGLKVTAKIDSSNNQALVTALYSSLGIAFLPDSYIAGHVARGKLKEITITDLTTNRTNNLVIHKNKKLNAIQQSVFDLIKTL